jgi:peptide chain release factor 2
MSSPNFWDDPGSIEPRLTTLGRLSTQVELVDALRRNLTELQELLEQLGRRDGDALGEAALRYRYLVRELPRVELTLLFDDPRDGLGTYLRIEARGRRAAAEQWVAELTTMYLKWAGRRQFPASVLSEEVGRNGTPHAVWLGIEGYGAYGLLKREAGSHRLVQPEPGKKEKRQVVQATVSVWPDLPQDDLPPVDRTAAVIRACAIRQKGVLLKHITALAEASLAQGEEALVMTGDLPADDLAEEALAILRITRAMTSMGAGVPPHPIWGDVVRSYVRYKQRYVHDTATALRTGKLTATLNGALDPFLEARLRLRSPEAGVTQPLSGDAED